MLDLFVARQPIFDVHDRLVAYELLYRSDPAAAPGDRPSSTRMATDTLVQALLGDGLARLTGGATAFINVDREVLLASPFDLLEPHRVVVELLETVACDAETRPACEALVQRGFTLALDDFVYDPSYDPLLRLARVVKVDVLGRTADELRPVVEQLRPFGVRLLAERVETAAVHEECRAMGFELFQGYYYARPELLSRREFPVQQGSIIRVLNLLRDPLATDPQIEEAFRGDLLLTYKLLRIVNSAAGGRGGVDSIRHAVQLLGRGTLHRWLALLLVSSLATASGAQSELVTVAMHRARLCELIAETLDRRREAAPLFVVGLFSLLDALMRRPMADILDRVDLAPELRQVLLRREGSLGPVLRLVEAFESARWDDVQTESVRLGFPLELLSVLYVDAAEWAAQQRTAAEG